MNPPDRRPAAPGQWRPSRRRLLQVGGAGAAAALVGGGAHVAVGRRSLAQTGTPEAMGAGEYPLSRRHHLWVPA